MFEGTHISEQILCRGQMFLWGRGDHFEGANGVEQLCLREQIVSRGHMGLNKCF